MANQPPGGGPTDLGFEPRVAAALCYVPLCVGLLFAGAAAIVEKRSRFVRFHAFQSLLVHAVALPVVVALLRFRNVAAWLGLWAIGGLVWVAGLVALAGVFAALVLLMLGAYAGEEFSVPVLGPLARRWA